MILLFTHVVIVYISDVTYVIALPCVDLKDGARVEDCLVDCIYEGQRSLYVHPDDCVDCGACEPVCPVEAISYEDDLPDAFTDYLDDNAQFFTDTLPRQKAPLGSPGGAAKVGLLVAGTAMVAAALPPQEA
jgi:NAD-dependent dihydropyrimidine dehydrogenase PreA subunit